MHQCEALLPGSQCRSSPLTVIGYSLESLCQCSVMAWILIVAFGSPAFVRCEHCHTVSEQLPPPAQRVSAGFHMPHQPLMRAFKSRKCSQPM